MTKLKTTKNITLTLSQEATDLRQQFLKSIENNELIQRLKQCSDTIADSSNANDKSSIDEKYQALVFISENEELYEFLRNNKVFKNMTQTQDLSFVYLFEEHSYDFYEISAMIDNEFPSCAKFKTDFAYIVGQGVGKISIAQMEQCIRFVLEKPYEYLRELGDDWIAMREDIESKHNYWRAVDGSNIENYINFFKKEIVRMKVSSISFAINGDGYEYSTSSIYC
jgi:hypothetical protein